MSVQPEENGQGSEQVVDQGNQQATDSTVGPIVDQQGNINPAWNDLLGVVPSQLHSQVTPHLQKWDQNFQSKIQEVHSQYEPWKPFLDNGVTPEDVEYSLGLLNAVSENPGEVIKALQEMVGADEGNAGQQGQNGSTPQAPEFDQNDPILSHPKVQEMQQAMENMAQILLSQQEQEQQSAADSELEQDLSSLKEKYGDFDEELVLALAMKNENFDFKALEGAVQSIQEKMKPPTSTPPPVLGGGGAVPPGAPDTSKAMSESDRKQLVANILAQAQQQQ